MELVGQRVDHGHAAGRGHRLDPVLAEGAPDDRRDLAVEHPGGVLDRLAAAELACLRVDDQREAAELGDADRERDPGAGDGLSKRTATARGPASGRCREPVGLHPSARSSTSACSVGREVVVAQEVPGHAGHRTESLSLRRHASSDRGQAPSTNVRRPAVGEDQRRREPDASGVHGVDEEPGLARGRLDRRRDRRGEHDAEQQARARGRRVDQRVAERRDAARRAAARAVGALEQAVALDRVEDGERGGARRPGCRRTCVPCSPAAEQRRGVRRRRAGADRQAAAEALGEGHDVGHDAARAWWANQAPVRPMPVCTSSRTSSAPCRVAMPRARPRGSRPAAGRRRPRPGSARGTTAAVRRPTAAAQRVGVAVRHEA